MRFVACDPDVNVKKGVMCLSRGREHRGVGRRQDPPVCVAWHRACRMKLAPPQRHNGHDAEVRPKLDSAALAALLKTIECLTADAASDVQLAGRELAGAVQLAAPNRRPLTEVTEQCLPNLKVHVLYQVRI